MNFKNLAYTHIKQNAELKKRQKSEWEKLLEKQDNELTRAANAQGLAGKFGKEREEHNEKFDREKAELIRQQQKELEEFQQQRPEISATDHEHEQD